MKKFILLITMAVLFVTVSAQSHYTVWHPAKAAVETDGARITTDANVILNMDNDSAELSVRVRERETGVCFRIVRVDTTVENRTVYVLDKKSSVTMFDTDEGTLCKFVINSPDNPDWDKIVLLFYM